MLVIAGYFTKSTVWDEKFAENVKEHSKRSQIPSADFKEFEIQQWDIEANEAGTFDR